MNATPSLTFAALLAGAVLAGCANSVPAPVLLSLPPALDASAAPLPSPPSGAALTPLLAIRRVSIPEYLESRRVRFRADASTLAEWPNTYWAERIEIGVSREFVSALRHQLPAWSLCDTTCGDALPALALQVDLVPMDYLRSAQKLQARARITLSSTGQSPRELQRVEKVYELAAQADTPQAHAQAISDLIRQVANAAAPLIQNTPR